MPPAPPASFDLIDAAARGYKWVWSERAYLFRLALIPLFIKFACHLVIAVNHWETMFVRQALVLLPSYFADGWMLAHFSRLIFLGQRWPFRPTGNPEQDFLELQDKAQGIMAGTVCYVLIRFVLAGYVGLLYEISGKGDPAKMAEQASPMMSLAALFLVGLSFWGFRLVWLYIPASVGWPLTGVLRALRGALPSLRLLLVALVCYMPLIFLFFTLALVIVSPFAAGETLPATVRFSLGFLQAAIEIVIGLTITAGVAEALRGMVDKGK